MLLVSGNVQVVVVAVPHLCLDTGNDLHIVDNFGHDDAICPLYPFFYLHPSQHLAGIDVDTTRVPFPHMSNNHLHHPLLSQHLSGSGRVVT